MERLFAQTRRALQDYLDQLVTLGYLQLEQCEVRNSRKYCRKEVLPFDNSSNQGLGSDFTLNEQADLAGALDLLSFLDPRLSPLAEKISVASLRHEARIFAR